MVIKLPRSRESTPVAVTPPRLPLCSLSGVGCAVGEALRASRFAWVSRLLPTLGHVARGQVSSIDETQARLGFRQSHGAGERWGLLSNLVGFVIRIRFLMYPACILQYTRILMYLDVSQTYLTCSVTFQENTCILTCCMYFTRISNEFKIHAGYT